MSRLFILDTADEEVRVACFRVSDRLLLGMAAIANFLGLSERFTIKTSQRKTLPTSPRGGPENEIVTPRSVEE
jgi:hypothetical protein